MKTLWILAASATILAICPAWAQSSKPDGQQLYSQNCAMCHGQNGKGTMPAAGDLTKPHGVLSKPEDILVQRTLEGFKQMPAFKGQLTEKQVDAIIVYMRHAFLNHNE